MAKYGIQKRTKTHQNHCSSLTKFPISNFFARGAITSKDATKSNRIMCHSVDRVATFYDAYGNKMVLRENQETINTPETSSSITYTHNGKRWTKRNKKN